MSEDMRNNGLHPRHPGKGQPTSMLALEGDEPSQGGALLFFPSGHHMSIGWQQIRPIYPVEGAAKDWAAQIVESMIGHASKFKERGDHDKAADVWRDIYCTNWNSVASGIAYIVRDFNARLTTAVADKLAAEAGEAGPGAEVVPYH